ncbi:PACE efflux transporter [Paracoccus sp. YIM 132242]|uniref:PACE efflux transporter n=1 Tax=Paracoccus lichenicola TaxID=2665644 RepID=A0A6L6HSQ1_9RHOB|nr:PACE efflux transporter [Paracoccus lichenicola]MTE01095.1 PACE efflux transporter [Paracoccus lichenicola]
MSLRSGRERMVQTATFETLGLAIVVPIHAQVSHTPADSSALLVATLAVIVTLWSPLFNTVFDRIDLAWSGRVASDRPHRLRLVHAALLELSALVVTVPVIMHLAGCGLRQALVFDLALTVFYTAFAYVFHLAYDRLRPVRPSAAIA